ARPAFSAADMEARRWLVGRMEEAGLDASIDGVGNVIGYSQNPGPALLLGSHTDSQPTGGWLNGALGVVYGLEAVRTMGADPETSSLSLDVVSCSDEEGAFMGTMGSKSFCGKLNHRDMERARNLRTGQSLLEAIAETGLENLPLARLDPSRHVAYLEAHIEQGPYLEADKKLLGVVTAIVGIRTFTIRFSGEQNHAPGAWNAIPSGAGHDAQVLARHIPSGMLFIPSIGGISHDIAEDTSEEDTIRGCRAFVEATRGVLEAIH
ncbi:MAG TPA: M20/M25/M40 family metallo-hydrolase, partial [Desulfobacteraceae bacterium]|nr:M20/M25/M40 family metallo-hydrolase [Desulfobacteraceae bacterium]